MAKKRRRGTGPQRGRGATTVERPARRTRAERKEVAREQREQLRRRAARAERTRRLLLVGVISGAIAVVAFFVTRPDEQRPAGALPGRLTTEAPWPANTADLAGRLDALGLPDAGGAMHDHVHLDLFVRGEAVPVPADVGVTASLHAPVHTHDDTGVIHLESAVVRDFTLQEIFDVWGVRLLGTCIGAYCEESEEELRIFVNGEEYAGAAGELVLANEDEVVVTFGAPDELPDPIPSTYDWSTLVA